MKEIISASRRTDMPGFYLDKIINCIEKGYAGVRNPFSGKIYEISLDPVSVHTIVLWSKNFRPFLKNKNYFNRYKLYFLFTINDMPELEPNVPSLEERFGQLSELAEIYEPDRVAWRYDPVVFINGSPFAGIDVFGKIAERVVKTGIKRVIFSFMDNYPKIENRLRGTNFSLSDISTEEKKEFASGLAVISREFGLNLENCCDEFGQIDGITKRGCIDGALLSELAGGEPVDLRKDPGQRKTCLCSKSRDIGSYTDMPCPHGCLYCYANPVINKFV